MQVGLIRSRKQLCGLLLNGSFLGENWLLGLRVSDWVSMTVCNELDSFCSPWVPQLKSIWYRKMTKLPSIPSDVTAFDIGMISAHAVDLQNLDSCVTPLPLIVLILDPSPTMKFNNQVFRLVPVLHSDVGGVTDSVSYFLLRGFSEFQLKRDIPQPLASIINHKLFVPACSDFEGVLNINTDTLPFSRPRVKVRLSRGYGSTDDGARFLSPAEVLTAWDIPRSYHPAKPTIDLITGLVPMKSILAIFDSAAPLVVSNSQELGAPPLPSLQSHRSDLRGTYLPSLKKWLSRAWIDQSLVAKVAKKANDASVPTHLWDMRICLPLGINHKDFLVRRSLRILRSFLLDRLKLNVI